MSASKKTKNEDPTNSPQLQKKNFSSSQKSNSSSSFIQINEQEENIHLCQEILNYFKQQQQLQNDDQQQSIIFFESQQQQQQQQQQQKNIVNLSSNNNNSSNNCQKKNLKNQENLNNLPAENNQEISKIYKQKKTKKITTLEELVSETHSEKSVKSKKNKRNSHFSQNSHFSNINCNCSIKNCNSNKCNSNNNNCANLNNILNNSDLSLDSDEKNSDMDSEKKFLEIFEKDPEIKKILQNQPHLHKNFSLFHNQNQENHSQQIEFVNFEANNCDCCNFEDVEINNFPQENSENESRSKTPENQEKNKQILEKKLNLLNSQKLSPLQENQLIFFNFDQIWFQEILNEINLEEINLNSENIIEPINYDKQWTSISESYSNNKNLILLKYSLDDQMLNDLKNFKNPIILGIQGSISEQIVPLVHKFKNLIGIIIYGTKRMQERFQQSGFFKKYKKIMTFVENKEQCYFEMKDYFVNYYKKKICKYKEIDNQLGKHLPVSSYLLKAPLKLMQAHYLLNSKYQFIKGKNEFFILSNFSEIKHLTQESIFQTLNELKSQIILNQIIFDQRVLKQSYIEKISIQFTDCIQNNQDEQEIAQAFLRLYLNCKPYFRLINQIMDSLDELVIQKAKIFITTLRLSIQIFFDIEDFWSQEQQKQQLNLLENSEGFINARALATNIQDCQKVLNPTISLYFGDRFYKSKYTKEKYEVGEQIVFPNFIRAVKNEEIGKQLATNQCGQKMTLFQIQLKKSQFQQNNNNFGTRLKAMFNSENQRPKSIKQFGKLDYQKVLKEYIINCFQVFKIEEINENFDGGFLLIRLSFT